MFKYVLCYVLIYIIIIIKSEVSAFPFVVIFFRGCVPAVVAPSYAVGFIYIPGKLFFVSSLLCSLMMCTNNRVQYDPMVVFVCLHITLHIIFIIHTYLTVLHLENVCRVYSVNSLNYLSCNIWGCAYSADPFLLWSLWEYMHFILLPSSNWKYDPLAIFYV